MDKQDELAMLVFRQNFAWNEDDEAIAEKWRDWPGTRAKAERIAAAVRSFMWSDEAVDEAVDAGAKFLRETQQAGKRLTPWADTPRATKKKWLKLSYGTISAAIGEDIGGGRG